jgi:hypothetical protein
MHPWTAYMEAVSAISALAVKEKVPEVMRETSP